MWGLEEVRGGGGDGDDDGGKLRAKDGGWQSWGWRRAFWRGVRLG